jgi:large repetitive protein
LKKFKKHLDFFTTTSNLFINNVIMKKKFTYSNYSLIKNNFLLLLFTGLFAISGKSQTEIIINNTPPDITINCDQDIPAVPDIDPTTSCDGEVMEQYAETELSGECPILYTIIRTWTLSDDCGNAEIITQFVVVQDNIAPVIIGIPDDATVTCDQIPNVAQPTATDNCGIAPTVVYNGAESLWLDGGCTLIIERSWSATDACGNTSTATQVITRIDTIAPVIVMGNTNAEISCSDIDLAAALEGNLDEVRALSVDLGLVPNSVIDNCCITSWTEVGVDIQEGNCPTLAIFTFSYVAADHCFNYSDTVTSTLVVVDNTAPIISCPPSVEIPCGTPLPEPLAGVEATDNCSDVTIFLFSETVSGIECNAQYTRTYRAIDACGNFSECSQTIVVFNNNESVLIACPSNQEIECGNQLPEIGAGVEASGGCSNLTISLLTEVITGEGCNKEYTRTYRAADGCGNFADCTQIILLNDNTSPTIECPASLELVCSSEIPAQFSGVFVSDECSTDPILAVDEEITGAGCNLTYTRIYRATDECGNFAECTQTITTNDEVDPVIDGNPEDITVECSDISEPGVYTATDNCDNEVLVVYSQSILEGECENDYTILRRWFATDECGNTATVSQSVSVFDNTSPEIECPANLELECPSDVPAPLDGVFASDNCSEPTIFLFNEIISGTGCNLSYTRTYRANDACGNFAECVQTITTNDVTPPVIDGDPEDLSVSCDSVPEPLTFTATDNCTDSVVITFSESILDGDCETGYLILRRWIATDDCGNSITVSQGINVGGDPGLSPLGDNTIRLSVYPNPTKAAANFNFMLTYDSDVNLNITTPEGNQIATIYNNSVKAGQEISTDFNSQQIAAGIYFYKLTTHKEIKIGRLVITK